MVEFLDCEQGSEEWFRVRLGKITASRFKDVLSKGTGRKTYMMKLVAERLTGVVQDGYTNSVMERGIEVEPQAREYYERVVGNKVKEVGFVSFDSDIGASPDGLIGDDGEIEIKCPNSTTHINTLLKGKMPTEYIPQVQGQLWVCERKFCDFISFDPRLKKRPFFCIRVSRDDKYIDMLSASVEQFRQEMLGIIKKVEGEQ